MRYSYNEVQMSYLMWYCDYFVHLLMNILLSDKIHLSNDKQYTCTHHTHLFFHSTPICKPLLQPIVDKPLYLPLMYSRVKQLFCSCLSTLIYHYCYIKLSDFKYTTELSLALGKIPRVKHDSSNFVPLSSELFNDYSLWISTVTSIW